MNPCHKSAKTCWAQKAFLTLLVFSCIACSDQGQSTYPDWAWIGFQRPASNPVITPSPDSKFFCPLTGDSVAWESSDTFNPAAAIRDGKIILLYRAEDHSGEGIGNRTSRLGYAWSEDGVYFHREHTPVLYPDNDDQRSNEWPGGCEDPRIAVTEDGTYVMCYTQWNRIMPRLAIATSRDLKHWEKHGLAFGAAYDGRFAEDFSKSASIVTRMQGDRQVIAKIDGKYWMYWGERFVNVATSEDLVHWTPLLDETGELLNVMQPRPGYFDSELTECGPPAILTEQGILLFYNGKNAEGEKGDTRYTANAYCAGQALFDAKDPTRLIDRLDTPFLIPEAPFEKSGQYPDGTVFIEGLVFHNGKWHLYYGCADSKVGVAILDTRH